jgi:hypothetical protein
MDLLLKVRNVFIFHILVGIWAQSRVSGLVLPSEIHGNCGLESVTEGSSSDGSLRVETD